MELLFTSYPLGTMRFFRRVILFGFASGLLVQPPVLYYLYSSWSERRFCSRVLRGYHLARLLLFCVQAPLRLAVLRSLSNASRIPERAGVVAALLRMTRSRWWIINQSTGIAAYVLACFALVFASAGRQCSTDPSSSLIAADDHASGSDPSAGSSPYSPLYMLLLVQLIAFAVHMLCSMVWLRAIVAEDAFAAAMWRRGIDAERIERCTRVITFPELKPRETPAAVADANNSEGAAAAAAADSNAVWVDGFRFSHLDCAICYNAYVHPQRVRILPCAHHYCVGCVDAWLVHRKCCPTCQVDIDRPRPDRAHESKFVQEANANTATSSTAASAAATSSGAAESSASEASAADEQMSPQQQNELLRLARRRAPPQAGDPSNDRIVNMVLIQQIDDEPSSEAVAANSAASNSSSSASSSVAATSAASGKTKNKAKAKVAAKSAGGGRQPIVRAAVLTPMAVSQSEADALDAIEAMCNAHAKPTPSPPTPSASSALASVSASSVAFPPVSAPSTAKATDASAASPSALESSPPAESAALAAASALSLSLSSSARVKQVQRPAATGATASPSSAIAPTGPVAPILPSSRLASASSSASSSSAAPARAARTAAPSSSLSSLFASSSTSWRDELDAWGEAKDDCSDDEECEILMRAAAEVSAARAERKEDAVAAAAVDAESTAPSASASSVTADPPASSSTLAAPSSLPLAAAPSTPVAPSATIAASSPAPLPPSSSSRLLSTADLDRLVAQWQLEEQQMQQQE